jgi:tetratricopeptide (TPR) repeat protein
MAWSNKGSALTMLGAFVEAVACFDKAIDVDPMDPKTWYSKALSEEKLDRLHDAAKSYRMFIDLAPVQYARQIAHAQQRLRELEGG